MNADPCHICRRVSGHAPTCLTNLPTPARCCGHTHTPYGCAGEPTPSDRWAGVTPAACDCDVVTPPGLRGPGPDEEPLSDDDPRYRCITCRRIVDPDLEPSAGEPLRCSDCHVDSLRDGRS